MPNLKRKAEDALADAHEALTKAQTKFDGAATAAHVEHEAKGKEIEALTAVITEKAGRRQTLSDLASEAYGMSEQIGQMSNHQP
jgi:hypothetical protein